MKDFDIVRAEREGGDRTFRLGGEEFQFRAYLWPDGIAGLQMALGDSEFLALADEVFPRDILEPGFEDAWARARSKDNPKPPGVLDIVAVVNYVQSVVAGRPTEPSSGSSSSPSGNGTGSTDLSASEESTSAVSI